MASAGYWVFAMFREARTKSKLGECWMWGGAFLVFLSKSFVEFAVGETLFVSDLREGVENAALAVEGWGMTFNRGPDTVGSIGGSWVESHESPSRSDNAMRRGAALNQEEPRIDPHVWAQGDRYSLKM